MRDELPRRAERLDLVDANGQVVTSSAGPVTVGPFEQIVKSWDDIADDDPAELRVTAAETQYDS